MLVNSYQLCASREFLFLNTSAMLQEAMCMLNKTFLFATVHVKLDVDALQLTKQVGKVISYIICDLYVCHFL